MIFIDMAKPPKCEWLDKDGNVHRCPILDGEDACGLQKDVSEDATWDEQYAGCPIKDLVTCKECINCYEDKLFGGLYCNGKRVDNCYGCKLGRRKDGTDN